ncbi:MAG: gluconate 2-dehydrogenase subunit 3 family protein [Acidimicrobiia bacterium]|nr:gluconate 2-dehydrogenase subunit 3 family protein [Acidimicrobiia bacterium]
MAKDIRKKPATEDEGSVSRRTFIQSVVAASAATGAAAALPPGHAEAAGAVSAPASPASSAGLKVLTDEQADLLTAVVNRLVPAEGPMPAAADVGIVEYIDGALADAVHLRQPILGVLDQVRLAGRAVLRAPDALDEVLTRVQASRKEAFETLLHATYAGYYSHPDVLNAIGWVPPEEHVDPTLRFDVAALEDVIQRGPIWRA